MGNSGAVDNQQGSLPFEGWVWPFAKKEIARFPSESFFPLVVAGRGLTGYLRGLEGLEGGLYICEYLDAHFWFLFIFNFSYALVSTFYCTE